MKAFGHFVMNIFWDVSMTMSHHCSSLMETFDHSVMNTFWDESITMSHPCFSLMGTFDYFVMITLWNESITMSHPCSSLMKTFDHCNEYIMRCKWQWKMQYFVNLWGFICDKDGWKLAPCSKNTENRIIKHQI